MITLVIVVVQSLMHDMEDFGFFYRSSLEIVARRFYLWRGRNMKRVVVVALLVLCLSVVQPVLACTTMLVGKDASIDGSVMV